MKLPVKIPKNVEILVKIGQKVDFKTPFFRGKKSQAVRIPLAEILGFKPEKIFLSLKKMVGDKIKKGDLLAIHESMFSTKQYLSSVNGQIQEIDHNLGTITVELESENSELTLCFFTGEIDAIDQDYIELKVKSVKKFDTKPNEHYLGGQVYYVENHEKPLTEQDIVDRCIFGTHINPLDHAKIQTLGAKAFITSNPLNIDLRQIILENLEDFDHIFNSRYPYCITGFDERSIFFYE